MVSETCRDENERCKMLSLTLIMLVSILLFQLLYIAFDLTMNGPFFHKAWRWLPRVEVNKFYIQFTWLNVFWSVWW